MWDRELVVPDAPGSCGHPVLGGRQWSRQRYPSVGPLGPALDGEDLTLTEDPADVMPCVRWAGVGLRQPLREVMLVLRTLFMGHLRLLRRDLYRLSFRIVLVSVHVGAGKVDPNRPGGRSQFQGSSMWKTRVRGWSGGFGIEVLAGTSAGG